MPHENPFLGKGARVYLLRRKKRRVQIPTFRAGHVLIAAQSAFDGSALVRCVQLSPQALRTLADGAAEWVTVVNSASDGTTFPSVEVITDGAPETGLCTVHASSTGPLATPAEHCSRVRRFLICGRVGQICGFLF